MTDKEIDARIDQVKKQSFGGSQAKLDKQLKEQGYTTESLRDDIRAQLLSEKIYDSVTKDAKVSDADIAKYYQAEQEPVLAGREPRRAPHPRQDEGAGRQDLRRSSRPAATSRRSRRSTRRTRARRTTAASSRSSAARRSPPFDTTAFLLSTNQISRPVKTAVRLPRDPADLRHQAGEGDAARRTRSRRSRRTLLDKAKTDAITKWTTDTKSVLRQEGLVRDRVRAAGAATDTATTTTG